MKKGLLKPLPKYYGRTELCDGRVAWLQSFQPPGRTWATHYTMIVSYPSGEAPDMTDFTDSIKAFEALAELQRQAVLDL